MKMTEPSKIDFNHRRISHLSDYTDIIEILFPGNRNMQHAAVCVLFELKWADSLVENLSFMEHKYSISRRILQRTRAKMRRLGIIEHISHLNRRYNGKNGWKLSTKLECNLKLLASKCKAFRMESGPGTYKEKERTLIDFADARRSITNR